MVWENKILFGVSGSHLDHMTKMFAMFVMVKPFENLLFWNQTAYNIMVWYVALRMWVHFILYK